MKRKLTTLLLLASTAAFAATEENIQKTFEIAPGGELVIDVNFGSVEVNTNGEPGQVAVDVWRRITRRNQADEEAFLREYPVIFSVNGNTLTIQCRVKENRNWWEGRRNRNEAEYKIRVPARFNLRLNTSGGAIAVSDVTGDIKTRTSGGSLRLLRLEGPLDGGTSGGGIRVSDCQGTIKLRTSGGGIDVTGGAGSLDGGTSGGGVTVRNFNGPASVGTSGGGVTVENVNGAIKGSTAGGPINVVLISPLPGEVKLSTSGGGVTVQAPEQTAFDLDASTSGGGVSCELPVTITGKVQRHELKGPVNGGGQPVHLRTSGGGIRVRKL